MKNRRKGFTLLEIQVVIVIMVALAIVIVPKLLSPIEKARQEEYIAKARLAYFACQIIATEEKAKGTNELELNRILEDDIDDKNNSQLDKLLGQDMKGSYIKGETSPKGIVTKVTYIDKGKNYKVTLEQMETGNGKIHLEDIKNKIK